MRVAGFSAPENFSVRNRQAKIRRPLGRDVVGRMWEWRAGWVQPVGNTSSFTMRNLSPTVATNSVFDRDAP
jgi:hypothetical protein